MTRNCNSRYRRHCNRMKNALLVKTQFNKRMCMCLNTDIQVETILRKYQQFSLVREAHANSLKMSRSDHSHFSYRSLWWWVLKLKPNMSYWDFKLPTKNTAANSFNDTKVVIKQEDKGTHLTNVYALRCFFSDFHLNCQTSAITWKLPSSECKLHYIWAAALIASILQKSTSIKANDNETHVNFFSLLYILIMKLSAWVMTERETSRQAAFDKTEKQISPSRKLRSSDQTTERTAAGGMLGKMILENS